MALDTLISWIESHDAVVSDVRIVNGRTYLLIEGTYVHNRKVGTFGQYVPATVRAARNFLGY